MSPISLALATVLLPLAEPAPLPDSSRTPSPTRLWAPRVGVSTQSRTFWQMGASRLTLNAAEPGHLSARGQYLVADFRPTSGYVVLGPRAGTFLTWRFLVADVSAAYYTDLHRGQFVLTPAAGLTAGGVFNLLYGYNQRVGGAPLGPVGAHQLSFSWHLLPM
ncbi:hypothetical protein [Hymenobacter sp. B81]|uniref:hypothetical protein n=1 Tax=Hymenobacter sp. B81 TaxID=3344878 RepID=UPI0037DC1C86